ncbi:hypothetical protein STENM327S_09067 [Streptomyces tendae]
MPLGLPVVPDVYRMNSGCSASNASGVCSGDCRSTVSCHHLSRVSSQATSWRSGGARRARPSRPVLARLVRRVVHEGPVQLHDGVRPVGHLVQDPGEPWHGEEGQLPPYVYVVDSFRVVVGDPGAGEAVQGDADGDGDAQRDALQDAEEHHAAGGDRVDQHFAVAGHRYECGSATPS